MFLNIAPFAYLQEEPSRLVFRWEEPRDLHHITLRLANKAGVPSPNAVEVHYWRCFWPQQRATAADLSRGGIGGSAGWKPRDDWFTGKWSRADAMVRIEGREVFITFAPLAQKEFSDLADFNVSYRQTMQLQIILPKGCAPVKETQIFTDTPLQTREIAVQFGCGGAAPSTWEGEVEIYNGLLEEARQPEPGDPRLRLKVACAKPGPLSYDHTIITLRSPGLSFSFRPEDLDEGQPIWAPDLGVLVSETGWNLRYSPALVASLHRGLSRYDAIAREPEQSLSRAKREQPPKEPMHFILGCEGCRQKFGLAPNGDLFAQMGFVRSVPGADTPRLGWEGNAFALRFGWDEWLCTSRRILRGYLPVLETRFSRGPLDIHLEAFATCLGQSLLAGPLPADTEIVCLLRLTFVNQGDEPLSVSQPFRFMTYAIPGVAAISRNLAHAVQNEQLRAEKDLVWATGDKEYLRMTVDTAGQGELVSGAEGLTYRLQLPAGASHSIVLKVPFVCALTPKQVESLRAKEFSREQEEVIRYWEDRLRGASEILTAEPDLNDFCRSLLTHILINDDREVGSDRLMGRVSSFNYGNFSNETIMQVMELDRRGLHEEARRHLAVFLHYQGTVGLPGNYQSKEGIFYGSGGYEHGGYNQHHGWVLWGLAEHYRFTGDRAWLLEIADRLIAGCEWVIRERQATKKTDAQGKKVLEHGFLPAGSLEDVTDYCYWLSTNAFTYRGLAAAAQALAEVGHPDGPRLLQEAAAYREDLLAGFREAMIRSPLVRLRDGTYVPHHPSRLYWRGRDFGWIREALEGSINLLTTLLDPQSQEATWILQDYEDNRYLDAPYNYPLVNFDAHWFSRGGFSMQPNLLYFPPPYLFRDQIEHFLRAFFNGFAACWRADLRAMTEHPLPTLADWAGDHFKSSDESMVAMWLRMMFIQEEGNTLYLGRGLPRAWLASDRGVAIRNAATYFGPVSLEMRPLDGGERILAQIEPPLRRPPEKVVVRFRHPHKARLIAVTVNGARVDTFDADKEWVLLPALKERTEIEARFSSVAQE